jgi:NitT/TauT family transport system permease protein
MQSAEPVDGVLVNPVEAHAPGRVHWVRRLLTEYPATIISTIVVLAVWELITQLQLVPKFLLPAPTAVVGATFQFGPLLLADTWVTLYEILLGFAVGSLVGLALAIGIVFSRVVEQIVYPPAVVTQMVPKLAIAPLFLVWFGVGVTPKIMITALICLFPVLVNGVAGMRSVDPRMLDLMHSVSASRWQIFTKVEFPNAAPYIFAGLKVGITLAVVGAIVGEWLGANIGLGYRILAANAALRTDLLFAAIGLLSLIGILLFGLVAVLEKVMIPGRRQIDTSTKGTL